MSTVGERIKLLRSGLSQKQLAEQLSIPQTTLSNYETNRSELNLATIAAITTSFGVTSDWLLFGEGQRQQATPPIAVPATDEVDALKKRIVELEWEKEKLERHSKALARENELVWEMRLSRDKDVEELRKALDAYQRTIDGMMRQLQTLTLKGEPAITDAPASALSAPSITLTSDG